jgi:hypothetical protein
VATVRVTARSGRATRRFAASTGYAACLEPYYEFVSVKTTLTVMVVIPSSFRKILESDCKCQGARRVDNKLGAKLVYTTDIMQ